MDEIMQLKASRFYLATKLVPGFSRVLFALEFKASDVPTLAIDQNWVVHYSPKFVEKYQKAIDFLVFHEASHAILMHPERFRVYANSKGLELNDSLAKLLNLAADMEIHSSRTLSLFSDQIGVLGNMLVKPGTFGLPENKTMEYYADRLLEISNASKVELRVRNLDEVMSGDSSDRITEAEKRAMQRAIVSDRKSLGNLPNYLDIIAEIVKSYEPQVPFHQLIDAKITTSIRLAKKGKEIRTYRRLSRRNPSPDILLAGKVGRKLNVALIFDTSGSISSKDLGIAVIEACSMSLRRIIGKDKVLVLACDTNVHVKKYVEPRNIVDIKFKGGGGTALLPAFEVAHQEKSDVIICFTDMLIDEHSIPEFKPDVQYIWVVIGNKSIFPAPSNVKFVFVEG